jgi:protein gp37
MSKRLKGMGLAKYNYEFDLTLHDQILEKPILWKKPRFIFVNSMSDLFHEQVPIEFIQKVFAVMKKASWHQFQVLTKRSERLLELDNLIDWPSNVWMGVSVESQEYTFRIEDLSKTHAYIKFVSFEPLLGPLQNFDASQLNWIIVGGESGPGSRPMLENWVIDIRDQCIEASIPFFFKQWGGVNKKKAGRKLQGVIWEQMPENVRG